MTTFISRSMGKRGHSNLYEPPGRGIAILVGSEGFNATKLNPLHLQWLSSETIHAAQGFRDNGTFAPRARCRLSFIADSGSSRHNMKARAAKSAAADEITAIEDLMADLEKRLHRLSGKAKREASGTSNDVADFVTQALARIMARVRDGTSDVADSATAEAAGLGAAAFKKIPEGGENRPLIMLGVAAGVGFLVGLANRR